MQRWTGPVVILFVAFLATVAYLSYQVAVNFMSWQNTRSFEDAFSEENYPPNAQQTTEMLRQIRDSDLYNGQPEVGWYYLDLLARNAWNHPDTAVDDLHEAIRVSTDIYRDYDYMRPHLIRWNMYIYYAAGLPMKVEMWESEAIAKDPSSLEYVRFMQMGSRILADDLDGARELLVDEIGEGEPRPTVAGLAVAGYSLLGEMDTAAVYEELIHKYGLEHDEYFKHSYSGFLVEQQRYDDALAILNEVKANPHKDPHDAQQLALINAGLYGINSVECQEMVELSLATTRRALTTEDLSAELHAQLYRIEEDPAHLPGLIELYRSYPDRFNVTYAMLISALACRELHLPAEPGGLVDPPAAIAPPNADEEVLLSKSLETWARESLELAQHDYERQMSEAVLAAVLVYPDQGDLTRDRLDQSIAALKRCLGDPDTAGSIDSQRIPDYDYILLDEAVIAAREANPDYDRAVNHAVIDYMNRRREIFLDVAKTKPFIYRDTVAPAQNVLNVIVD